MNLNFLNNLLLPLAIFSSIFNHQLDVSYLRSGDIQINNPQVSQIFYDELKGQPRNYFFESSSGFQLNLNVLVPEIANKNGKYNASVSSINGESETIVFSTEALSSVWEEYYDSFDREYYLKGPEITPNLTAGKYKIQIYSQDNQGKYVLKIGKNPPQDILALLNMYWQMPLLKFNFFNTSIVQFFLTPVAIFGVAAIGVFIILILILKFIISLIIERIKHRKAKTLLLTSAGMAMKEEIQKLLQKPAYDITVGFIITAAKPEQDLTYVKKDWVIMREEMGFNVEEIDIEGKKEAEVMKMLQLKDIIFVEGGNTFYLLKAMRKCNFKRVMKKLLKLGKVYVGASAGSIVAGRSIKTAEWVGDKNLVKLVNLKGLNLVKFDVFVHFQPEHAEIIKKKLPFKWQRRKLKILTDEQAILVQGREVALIGKGNEAIV
jgi:dipeptidase E